VWGEEEEKLICWSQQQQFWQIILNMIEWNGKKHLFWSKVILSSSSSSSLYCRFHPIILGWCRWPLPFLPPYSPPPLLQSYRHRPWPLLPFPLPCRRLLLHSSSSLLVPSPYCRHHCCYSLLSWQFACAHDDDPNRISSSGCPLKWF